MNVNVISPTGELGNIPDVEVENALKYGYRLATNDELKQEYAKNQYGTGFLNELEAGVEGAMSGATFGLSRHAANALGLTTPEAQAARKEFNPGASMLGEGVGIVGSLLVPGGGLVGAVGKGSAKLGTGIAARTLEQGVARKIVGNTIAGAVEGLAYGAAQPISESALGDPTLTAQKVLSQIGVGGLLGGAMGTTFTALGLGGKRLLSKSVSPEAKAIVSGADDLPLKMEGTIDFGIPDEKILKRAQSLNPKNPLKKNDLDFIKKETPEIFDKIGTPEVPTLDPMATDKVYMGDAVREGMKKVRAERIRLDQLADEALSASMMANGKPLAMTRKQYLKMFQDTISEIKKSKEFGLPIGKRAVKSLENWKLAAKDLPDEILATDIRDIMQNIRQEGRLYVKGGGLKDDFVSKSLNKVQSNLDDYLKDNSKAYKKIQEEFAPFTRNNIELQDHLKWDWQKNDSDLVSDWVTNRIAKPFQSSLPGTKNDADLIRWFGKYAGVDFEKASKANFIYGKLNPETAQAGQLGSWGSRVVEGINLIRNPMEIPGKILSGSARVALEGKAPEFWTNFRAKGVQDLLLGKSSNPQAVNSILSKFKDMSQKGSKFLEGPFSDLLIPAGVKLEQFVNESDSIDQADRKLEILNALEKAQKKSDEKIDRAVKSIFSEKRPLQALKNEILNKSPKELADDFDELRNQTNELVNNPEKMMQKLEQANQGMDDVPNVVSGLNMTTIRAVQLLSQKMNEIMPKEKLPLDAKYVPSNSQIYSLTKMMRYINQPWDVLNEIATGRISPEGTQVMTQVYPELYADMQALLMGGISEQQAKGKRIPMAKRLAASAFLGQPLDSTMKPQSIMNNQAALMMPVQNQPKPRASSAKGVSLSNQMQTPIQKVANRNN